MHECQATGLLDTEKTRLSWTLLEHRNPAITNPQSLAKDAHTEMCIQLPVQDLRERHDDLVDPEHELFGCCTPSKLQVYAVRDQRLVH